MCRMSLKERFTGKGTECRISVANWPSTPEKLTSSPEKIAWGEKPRLYGKGEMSNDEAATGSSCLSS